MLHFIYNFSTNTSTEYFKHAAQSPFFYSKCRLFHNAIFFGSYIIHILHTGFAASAVVAPDDGHENARNMLSCI
jgi:hypothetical protein